MVDDDFKLRQDITPMPDAEPLFGLLALTWCATLLQLQ